MTARRVTRLARGQPRPSGGGVSAFAPPDTGPYPPARFPGWLTVAAAVHLLECHEDLARGAPIYVQVTVRTARDLEREEDSHAENIARAQSVRDVACPRCASPVGRKCRSATGAVLVTWGGSHAARLRAAGLKP